MGNIIILDENTSNMIAAGEVVERPSSVVKELVENSIDANAKNIVVEIKKGGISFIRVTDDGNGIKDDDIEIAFERHATSKIKSKFDLDKINTMGFRGEALSSIASVSKIELISRTIESDMGSYINVEGGKVKEFDKRGASKGTIFTVKELFFNTPARYKFLKRDSTETGYISDIINKIALGNPDISFKLISNGKTVIHTPGNGELKSSIYSIYGNQVANALLLANYDYELCTIKGYVGKPEIARANRNCQLFYINDRVIKSKVLYSAVEQAFKTYVMKHKFPFLVLKITLPPADFDINVHPTKMEVRFKDEKLIFKAVYYTVKNALLNNNLIRENDTNENYIIDNNKKLEIKSEEETPKKDFSINKIYHKEYTYENNDEIKSFSENTDKKSVINTYNNILKKIENNKLDNNKNEKINELSNEIKKDEIDKVDINNNLFYKNDTKLKEEEYLKLESDKNKNTDETCKEYSQVDFLDKNKKYKEDSEVQKEIIELKEAKIIGQFFMTYIMLERNSLLYLIDQHAAHERIIYERLLKRDVKNFSQILLKPEIIEVSSSEIIFINENKEELKSLGFEIDEFSRNSIAVRSIPTGINNETIEDIFYELIEYLNKNKHKDREKMMYNEDILYTIACKSAVKANKKLSLMEIERLVDDLIELTNPFTCPHGRPVIIKITKNEIEKMFKRIV
jgi:DNA mismatch repair protein MutL